MKTLLKIVITVALTGMMRGQTGSFMPWLNGQFTDSNGVPLSGGKVYTCSATGSCPGSPQPTYTSSSLFTQNDNPITLSASGRTTSGIWLIPGLAYTFVVTDQLGNVIPGEGGVNIVGAAASTSTGGGGGGGGGAAGSSTYVQFNTGGNFDASGNFTFNKSTQSLTVLGISGTAAITASGGFIQSNAGILSVVTGGSWQGFNSPTDGAAIRSLSVAQNTANTAGGYINLAPVTYNPYNGSACVDANGNPVQQPLPLNGLSAFGTNSTVMWVTQSPQMPPGGSCGAPLPVQEDWGLAINSYLFARGGLATDNASYNAINTVYLGGGVPAGGVEAGSLTAGTLYPAGTVTTTTTLTVPTYLGGYVNTGHSSGPPAAGTIATVTNPFNQCGAASCVNAGAIYYDDALTCENLYNGTTWNCLGSGSGGSGIVTASPQYQVPYYSASGTAATLTGSSSLTWNQSTKILTVTAAAAADYGLYVATGYGVSDKGWASINCTTYNCIQVTNSGSSAFTGGMAALSFTAQNYIQAGNSNGPPSVTLNDTFHPGALYWDTGSHSMQVRNEASAWVSLGGGTGSPGGSTTDIQFNSSGGFGGNNNLTWTTASGNTFLNATATSALAPGVNVSTGYMSADQGFLANGSTCIKYNCLQSPGGGAAALSGTFVNYIQPGSYSSGGVGNPPPLTNSDTFHAGAISWDTFSSALRYFDGTNWDLFSGGGGTAAGINTQIQYNNFGAFGASANLAWINAANDLVVTGIASQQTIWAKNGYIQADTGFVAPSTCILWNCVQSQGGGIYANKSIRAGNYTGTGNSTGVPGATSGDTSFPVRGDMYFDNAFGAERVYNGSTWLNLATGGIPSLNSLTGALNITNGGTTNQITVSPSGTTIALTLPQGIGIGSSPSFNQVTTSGANGFVSTVTGTNYAFVANGGTFLVNGNGAVTASGAVTSTVGLASTNTSLNSIQSAGSANMCNSGGCAGSAAYQVDGSTVISNAAQWVGGAVTPVTGNIGVPSGYTFAANTGSGFVFGQTHSVVIGSCTIFFQSGIAYAFSGC